MAKCCGQEETGKRDGQGRTLEEEAELPWREAMQRGTGQKEGKVKVWGARVGEKVWGRYWEKEERRQEVSSGSDFLLILRKFHHFGVCVCVRVVPLSSSG